MKKSLVHSVLALLSLLLVLAAWAGGALRLEDAAENRVRAIRKDITDLRKVDDGLYEGRNADGDPLFIALESHPGYGGPVRMAVVVNAEKRIETVAIVDSAETRPYLVKVLEAAIPDAFLGKSIEHLPQVDAISGATMSSEAVIKGAAKAAALVGAQRFGLPPLPVELSFSTEELIRLGTVACFFFFALFIGAKRFPWNKSRARLALLALSVVVLGFWHGSQFSLSTMALLLSGFWLKGLASWAPLLCLLLALGTLVLTRKNHYCASICPFGGLQECLSRVTSCSAPTPPAWMVWTSRLLALLALCVALYFRAPSDAIYEPFGKTFNGIGSGYLFALSVAVILASLVFKRPWCRLLCPVTPLMDYVRFARERLIKRKPGTPDIKENEA